MHNTSSLVYAAIFWKIVCLCIIFLCGFKSFYRTRARLGWTAVCERFMFWQFEKREIDSTHSQCALALPPAATETCRAGSTKSIWEKRDSARHLWVALVTKTLPLRNWQPMPSAHPDTGNSVSLQRAWRNNSEDISQGIKWKNIGYKFRVRWMEHYITSNL